MPGDGFPVALVAAHLGRVDEARERAERDLADAETMDIRISVAGSEWLLGFLELSLGDASAALVHLRRSYELRSAFMLEPAQRLELGDLLEALIAADELDEAEEVIAEWQGRADSRAVPWAAACGARGCRRRARELRAVARRACERRRSLPARPHAAFARCDATAREAARRSPHDPGRGARRLQTSGLRPLGREGARRSWPNRGPRALAR